MGNIFNGDCFRFLKIMFSDDINWYGPSGLITGSDRIGPDRV